MRMTNTMNILKSLFRGSKAIWEQKYLILRDFRLHIFQVQKDSSDYTKPFRVMELTENLSIKEIRKADIGGKAYVLEIIANDKLPEKDRDMIHIACPGYETQNKWKRCLRNVKELYSQADKYKENYKT